MSRKRIEDVLEINTWEDADAVLKEIAQNEIAIDEIEGVMNKDIHDIKEQAAMNAQPHKARIKELEQLLKTFVTVHKSELDGKTKTLNFGQTGFRASTSIGLPRDKDKLQKIIDFLKKNGMGDCIVVTEKVNKDVLRKYGENRIIRAGVKIKKQDAFWYEAKRDEIQ